MEEKLKINGHLIILATRPMADFTVSSLDSILVTRLVRIFAPELLARCSAGS